MHKGKNRGTHPRILDFRNSRVRPSIFSLVLLWVLLSLNSEIALHVFVGPRSDNRTIVQSEIFNLAVDDVVNGLTRRVFSVGLEMNHPSLWFEGGILQGDSVWTGIELAGDLFAIPVHDDRNLISIRFIGAPIA